MNRPDIADLTGLWRRSLIVRPDGTRDTTRWVGWLQGPSDYADLRQPDGRPDFAGVGCLRRLTPTHLAWLATQDGFAGKLSRSDGLFTWRRDIDFQPPAPTPDCGTLARDGDLMIEEGYHEAYIEHWHLDPGERTPCFALRLRDPATGAAGQIVRAGALFIYARAHAEALPPGVDLAACIAGAATQAQAQDMVDCEISFGRVAGPDWTIARSTLPFREGRRLALRSSATLDRLTMPDLTPDGREIARNWQVTTAEGTFIAADL